MQEKISGSHQKCPACHKDSLWVAPTGNFEKCFSTSCNYQLAGTSCPAVWEIFIQMNDALCLQIDENMTTYGHTPTAWGFLQDRGVSEIIAKTFYCGVIPEGGLDFSKWQEDINARDRLYRTTRNISGWLVLASTDSHGNIVAFTFRNPKQKRHASWRLNRKPGLFGATRFPLPEEIGDQKKTVRKEMILIESPIGLLYAQSVAYRETNSLLGFVSLGSSTSPDISELRTTTTNKEIFLFPDNDEAGNKLAIKLARSFPDLRICAPCRTAPGNDLEDFLRETQAENKLDYLSDHLSASQKATEFLAEKGEGKLTTASYLKFFEEQGWYFKLNELNDTLYCGDEIVDDPKFCYFRCIIRDNLKKPQKGFSMPHATDAIWMLAGMNRFNPIKEYFENLEWDGQDWIGKLCQFFQSNENLHQYWFPRWLAGVVARALFRAQNPMLVLAGPQSLGKSHFASWLCPLPEYFLSSPIAPDNKDCKLRLIDSLIWEVTELGATTRRQDIEALKGFQTVEIVRERKPYGHFDLRKPAVCSFIGTVNPGGGFLVDITGNRRYLVTEIELIDWSYTNEIDKDQLWAQAVVMARDKQNVLTPEEVQLQKKANEQHRIVDPVEFYLEEEIEISYNSNDFLATSSILNFLQGKGYKPSRALSHAVAGFMRKLGAVQTRKTENGAKMRGYAGVRFKFFVH